ncbi:MFS general substrate transporter [Sistotremastrum niveocremeum HHB9708]|uniref:MFS general substrate transporter n=2 Tax=Sistotremastraceae TaxID=3402574 RepID=A0A164U446_9AGAM|nr:MFS general substrate transporter [Sistotremastrum niveocremeum HHB9708]KZT44429.1 MFS general substrate transporter [Sistotremastrum suecicum HHB10207 ss-3]
MSQGDNTSQSSLEKQSLSELYSKDSSLYAVSSDASSGLEGFRQAGLGAEPTSGAQSLPPVDAGFGAWSYLAAAFFVEAIVWGFPISFGVFLEAYLKDPHYAAQPSASSLLPLIGSLSSGIIYCSGPFIYPFIARFPFIRHYMMWVGLLLCFSSLFGASYATSVHQLVLLQGAIYGIGGSLMYAPCISFLSEWFVERRGLANGIIFAGTAAGAVFLPFVIPDFIAKYGIPATLRIIAIAVLLSLLVCLPFLRGRLPTIRVSAPRPRGTDMTWAKDWTLWLFVAANTFQGLAYSVPITWIPTFASAMDNNTNMASLALVVLNASSVVSRVGMGHLSDIVSPWFLGFFSLIMTSLSTFLLWGLASHSMAGLILYGLTFGTIAGGWTSLYSGFCKPLSGDDVNISTNLFGLFMLSRGIGSIVSTPISTSLRHAPHKINGGGPLGFNVDGGMYENLILFTGACFAGAAILAILGWATQTEKFKTRRKIK